VSAGKGSEGQRTTAALRAALRDMLRVYEMLMPGLRYIPVTDYRLVNEAPIRARAALRLR
jgi:hypothetical protein